MGARHVLGCWLSYIGCILFRLNYVIVGSGSTISTAIMFNHFPQINEQVPHGKLCNARSSLPWSKFHQSICAMYKFTGEKYKAQNIIFCFKKNFVHIWLDRFLIQFGKMLMTKKHQKCSTAAPCYGYKNVGEIDTVDWFHQSASEWRLHKKMLFNFTSLQNLGIKIVRSVLHLWDIRQICVLKKASLGWANVWPKCWWNRPLEAF